MLYDLRVPPATAVKVVLIVEDDAQTRELYRSTLKAHGYQVMAVEDGFSALQVVEADPPDVIVLDMALPRLSGRDVLRELRGSPMTRNIPVVIATGTDVADLDERAGSQVLRKPIDADTLVDAVENAFRRTART